MNPSCESEFPVTKTSDRVRQVVVSLGLASGFVTLLCVLFEPRWESNDDVAMSMIAHGYGIADHGSPHLLFSNVLWGIVVRSLPPINGVLGYSVATLLSLLLAAAATVYFLLRTGVGYGVSLFVLAIVFARPILFPQFTITAGLLAVTAVLGLRAYACHRSSADLTLACFLAFMAFLIRNLEFMLVFAVGLPLLPWAKLVKSPAAWIAAVGLAITFVAATIFDVQSYAGTDWQAFWQTNLLRAPLTDTGAAGRILQHPDIIHRVGFSENDVRLVANWFFADPHLTDPATLRKLLGGIPTLLTSGANVTSGLTSLSGVLDPPLVALAMTALALLVLCFRPNVLLAGAACLALMFAFGAVGRLNVPRVYIPLMSMMLAMPCVITPLRSWRRIGAVGCVLLGGFLLNGDQLLGEVLRSQELLLRAHSEKFTARDSVVAWGSSLPIEYIFPVFTREADITDTRIYGLGVATLAPFSVARADERAGNGFLTRFRSRGGVQLVAGQREQSLLDTYCKEHFGVQLKLSIVKRNALWTVSNASCAALG